MNEPDASDAPSERTHSTATERPLPPGPNGWPVVGNTVQFASDIFAFYDALDDYGDVVSYSVAGFDSAALFHPEQVERVFVTEADKYRKADILRRLGADFIENGLFLAEGEEWRRQRNLLQPVFFRERVERFTDHIVREVEAVVGEWDDGEVVDLQSELQDLAMQVFGKTLFGVEMAEEYHVLERAAHAVQNRSDTSSLRAFLPRWLPTPKNRRFDRTITELDDVLGRLIERRKGELGDHDDILSTLLAADGLSDREVREQLTTFLFAGFDTTSLGMTYATYALAANPAAAESVRAEVTDLVGDGDLDAKTIRRLDDTEKVLKEALRLYPPGYLLFRQPTEDVTLGGYRLPEGTNISIPVFRIHRDGRFYDDPDEFRPRRWTDEMEDDLPDCAYLPFGRGPRHCIGMRFAMIELQVLLATVARQVDLDLVGDADIEFDASAATLQPADPIRVRVNRRDAQ